MYGGITPINGEYLLKPPTSADNVFIEFDEFEFTGDPNCVVERIGFSEVELPDQTMNIADRSGCKPPVCNAGREHV